MTRLMNEDLYWPQLDQHIVKMLSLSTILETSKFAQGISISRICCTCNYMISRLPNYFRKMYLEVRWFDRRCIAFLLGNNFNPYKDKYSVLHGVSMYVPSVRAIHGYFIWIWLSHATLSSPLSANQKPCYKNLYQPLAILIKNRVSNRTSKLLLLFPSYRQK